jgi:hypothetical protein
MEKPMGGKTNRFVKLAFFVGISLFLASNFVPVAVAMPEITEIAPAPVDPFPCTPQVCFEPPVDCHDCVK